MNKHRNWIKRLSAWDGVDEKNKMKINRVFWSIGEVSWILFRIGVCLGILAAGIWLGRVW
jgi:hypothetical protein